MLADSHNHTKFSHDSTAEPVDMLRRAAELGFSHYCITEHVDFDATFEICPPVDVRAYRDGVLPLKDRFPGLELHLGLEVAIQDEVSAARAAAHIGGYDWDCIVGSVHNTDHGDPYAPAFFEGRSRLQSYRDYVETIAERMNTLPHYHVLAHVDYVVKYGPYREPLTYRDAPDAFDHIFRSLVEHGRTLEFNTSSQRDIRRPLWGLDYLKRYAEMGGEALSFGSDAHRPEQLGYRFKEAHALAWEAGIRWQAVYIGGERHLFPLEG